MQKRYFLISMALMLFGFASTSFSEDWPTLEQEIAKSKVLNAKIGYTWAAACQRDAMTDKIDCTLEQYDSSIMVDFGGGASPIAVCIVSHDFPGRRGAIRVDGNKAITTNNYGCAPAQPLFNEMKIGKTIRSQYYKWPYDFPQDAKGTLTGIANSIAELPARRANPE